MRAASRVDDGLYEDKEGANNVIITLSGVYVPSI
jgi:hypothetical protein